MTWIKAQIKTRQREREEKRREEKIREEGRGLGFDL
jgi:hypothetical protein